MPDFVNNAKFSYIVRRFFLYGLPHILTLTWKLGLACLFLYMKHDTVSYIG